MAILSEYDKPKTLAEALDLLSERKSRRLPLAGGTQLVGALETRQRTDVDGVVDLSGLDLSYIHLVDSSLHIGAMTTLTDLIEHPLCADLAGGILAATARFEGPLNLRNAATVGGLVALAEPDSELYAALLALNASAVTVDQEGVEAGWQLEEFAFSQPQLARPPILITEIRLPLGQVAGGHARIARTPMDRCIVAAVTVTAGDGDSTSPMLSAERGSRDSTRTALCGVGPRPQLAGSPISLEGDFKGSAEYRLAMAEVVGQRARFAAKSIPQ